jgi:hypothetical protein
MFAVNGTELSLGGYLSLNALGEAIVGLAPKIGSHGCEIIISDDQRLALAERFNGIPGQLVRSAIEAGIFAHKIKPVGTTTFSYKIDPQNKRVVAKIIVGDGPTKQAEPA